TAAVGARNILNVKNPNFSNPPAERLVGFLFAHMPAAASTAKLMKETTDSLRANLRALPRGAWILFFGTFLNKFGTFVLPFLAIYMTGLGYSTADASMAIAAYGIGTLAASLLGGYLADTIGRRKTIVLSMFSVAGAML